MTRCPLGARPWRRKEPKGNIHGPRINGELPTFLLIRVELDIVVDGSVFAARVLDFFRVPLIDI